MKLEVRYKKVYGREFYVPENSIAKTICKLMKRKVLSKKELKLFSDEGIEIIVHYDERNDTI